MSRWVSSCSLPGMNTKLRLVFPEPFGDSIVQEIRKLLEQGEVHDLTLALDAQINAQTIPEWYRRSSISRIYCALYELQLSTGDRAIKEKVSALLTHMRKKYKDHIILD